MWWGVPCNVSPAVQAASAHRLSAHALPTAADGSTLHSAGEIDVIMPCTSDHHFDELDTTAGVLLCKRIKAEPRLDGAMTGSLHAGWSPGQLLPVIADTSRAESKQHMTQAVRASQKHFSPLSWVAMKGAGADLKGRAGRLARHILC